MKTVFQHINDPNLTTVARGLRSTILVEDLLLNNLELFAICIALETEKELSIHNSDRERIDYMYQFIVSLKEYPDHCGDCTCVPATCIRCMMESIYIEGLAVKLNLEMILATEHEWVYYNQYLEQSFNYKDVPGTLSKQELIDEADKIFDQMEDIKYRINQYHDLSDDQKKFNKQRAEAFMHYLQSVSL